ncbi:MAG: glutathione peroxidase [Geminicoccaceae bacterium]|nr:glutathione peroxidase [Geminicoccaceae bacterium]MDW8369003.1 glutathione peroxidase [Geminicoccaceae bacterium]
MRLLLALIALLAALGSPSGDIRAADRGAHAFAFTSIEGEPLPLERFAGRPLLVVNTASLCGYTYQYAALQRLWARYRDRGLVVLGVPSNDFGNQEPGTAQQIKTFCETNFDVDFPLTDKVSVRGPGSHPLFAWLRRELGEAVGPRWNFHKFLIGPDGRAVAAWPSRVEPDAPEITAAIERLLPPAGGAGARS